MILTRLHGGIDLGIGERCPPAPRADTHWPFVATYASRPVYIVALSNWANNKLK